LSPDVLVTGGSDGRVITYDLEAFKARNKIFAHDSSVTSLQFNSRFIVTGGNDGKVKLWNVENGQLIREIWPEGECVWKVRFNCDDKLAIMGRRTGKSIVEVWSFSPEPMMPDT
jgi:F-box and WD-40 domain protein CDC4